MSGQGKRKHSDKKKDNNKSNPTPTTHAPQHAVSPHHHLQRSQSNPSITNPEQTIVPYDDRGERRHHRRPIRYEKNFSLTNSHPTFPMSIENTPLKWTSIKTPTNNTPSRRGFHSCTAVDDTLIVIGGDDSKSAFYSDMWCFNCATRSWRVCGDLGLPRTGHTCVYYNNCLYLFGGKQQNKYMSELRIYSFDTRQWTTHRPSNNSKTTKLIARGAHTASVVGNKMYIFGGLNSGSKNGATYDDLDYLNSMCIFDLDTHVWTIPKNLKGMLPPKRAGHSCAVIGNTIYVFGGRSGSVVLHDFYAFDTDTFTWTKIIGRGDLPAPRAGHTLVAYGHYLLLWGGSDWSTFFYSVHTFDLRNSTWVEQRATGDTPGAKFWHTSVVINDSMWVFGGGRYGELFNDLHELDLSTLQDVNGNTQLSILPPRNNSLSLEPITPNTPLTFGMMKVKTVYLAEMRVMKISMDISYEDLLEKLRDEYGLDNLTVVYIDEEDDEITIRSDAELRSAIEMFKASKKTLRLEIKALQSGKKPSVVVDNTPVPVTPGTIAPVDNPAFMWQPGREIGRGAYGVVCEALNVETGEFMAVKKIAINKRDKEKTIREVVNEIELMKRLKHENIVRYLGVDRDQDTLYIFLEYVAGGSIQSLLGVFKMFHESVVRLYTKQILQGLKYLHDNEIVHRDIKAANILVNHSGVVKLADFGHSKMIKQGETAGKSIRGTPMWMAPEVILQNNHGKKSDIWSVGCTIIEMITGDHPWPKLANQEPVTIMYHIAAAKKSPKIPSKLSAEGKRFLKRCFELDPANRASVEELLQEPFVTQPLDPWAPVAEVESESEDSDSEDDDDEEDDEDEETESEEEDYYDDTYESGDSHSLRNMQQQQQLLNNQLQRMSISERDTHRSVQLSMEPRSRLVGRQTSESILQRNAPAPLAGAQSANVNDIMRFLSSNQGKSSNSDKRSVK